MNSYFWKFKIPELKDDFEVPLYCFTESDDVDVNCWIGPKGTVSPLHTDPKHNLLAQVNDKMNY
jgi:lysine-specific demethylase 8